MRRSAITFLSLLLSSGWVGSGCNLDNPGDDPPAGLIYLPTGMVISAAGPDEAARYLYLVNSNFDLRYNSGSLQAFDLEVLDREVAECEAKGRLGAVTCTIDPLADDLLADEVLVPSLASYIAPSSGFQRLYISTRTETSLTFVDVREDSDNVLRCDDSSRHCSSRRTQYADPVSPKRRLVLPREAVAITAGAAQNLLPGTDSPLSGEFVLVAHRNGEVSLLLDDLGDEPLQLQDVLTLSAGGVVVRDPTGITFDPMTRLAYVTINAPPTISSAGKKVVARVGIASSVDPEHSGDGPDAENVAVLYDADALTLEGVSTGLDTRAVTMNPSTPGEALVVSRTPNSLLWVDVASALNGPAGPTQGIVRRTTTVGRGPSRVITGKLGDRTLAIVTCFDARQIYMLDAQTSQVLSIVHNFSGPFEVALDSARRRLYVADFRSSVVRVLDLAPLVDGASESLPTARIVATLGIPQLVQELQ